MKTLETKVEYLKTSNLLNCFEDDVMVELIKFDGLPFEKLVYCLDKSFESYSESFTKFFESKEIYDWVDLYESQLDLESVDYLKTLCLDTFYEIIMNYTLKKCEFLLSKVHKTMLEKLKVLSEKLIR